MKMYGEVIIMFHLFLYRWEINDRLHFPLLVYPEKQQQYLLGKGQGQWLRPSKSLPRIETPIFYSIAQSL
jgi:hypothetical protein